MKIIKTFAGDEYVISDEEAVNIDKIKKSGQSVWLELRCGASMESSTINTLMPIPMVKIKHGQFVVKEDSNGNEFYMEYGNRIMVEDQENVTYLPDPKYHTQSKFLLEDKPKPKQLSNEEKRDAVRKEGSSPFANYGN